MFETAYAVVLFCCTRSQTPMYSIAGSVLCTTVVAARTGSPRGEHTTTRTQTQRKDESDRVSVGRRHTDMAHARVAGGTGRRREGGGVRGGGGGRGRGRGRGRDRLGCVREPRSTYGMHLGGGRQAGRQADGSGEKRSVALRGLRRTTDRSVEHPLLSTPLLVRKRAACRRSSCRLGPVLVLQPPDRRCP